MAIAIGLPGFNDLGRSVTPTFDELFSLPISTCSKKMKKILGYRLQTLQNTSSNSFQRFQLLSVLWFKIPLEGLSLLKTLAAIENYLRNRPTSTKYGSDRLPPLTHVQYV